MATFVLIHGGGDVGWFWHLVEAALRERGHDAVAPDLPCDDDSAGLSEYTDAVLDAIGDRSDLVVVGHSLGGFTAPLVCDRTAVELLVLVAAMIPSPGEPPGEWGTNTRYEQEPREEYGDELATFFHDVPPELAAEAMKREREQSGTPMQEPWPLEAWPDVPTRFLLCRGDRLFPAAFMRRVARERLGIAADEIDGGHCVALSRPQELAERLDGYYSSQPWAPP
jgi:pimeloyl-ACP methyl ester carboxylesterase